MDHSAALSAALPQSLPSAMQQTPGHHTDPAAAGKAFEGMFASMLVKQMRQTHGESMFGSDGGDVLGGLFDHFMGEHMAKAGGFGVGKMIRMQLERQPERTRSS